MPYRYIAIRDHAHQISPSKAPLISLARSSIESIHALSVVFMGAIEYRVVTAVSL